MTAEQKQRALTALGMWHSSNDSSQREYQAAELMAALLQELVDAPEAEPVARVTGYCAGYLTIATIDGRVLPAGTALYNDKRLVTNVETIVDELISEQIKASEQRQTITGLKHLIAQIRATLDLPINASSMDILAEVENISHLADRAIQTGARDAVQGPYIIISDPRGCAGIHETIDEARKLAEGIARRSTSGRSAIVSVVAEVELVPQWSDAK